MTSSRTFFAIFFCITVGMIITPLCTGQSIRRDSDRYELNRAARGFDENGDSLQEQLADLSERLFSVGEATPPPVDEAFAAVAEQAKKSLQEFSERESSLPDPRGNQAVLGARIAQDATMLGDELVRNAAIIVEELIQRAKMLQIRIEIEAARLVSRIVESADELVERNDRITAVSEVLN